ncbi:MAG TPA: hypothetical protein VEV43_11455 [Actinomycetota bacterium]|nr:hypothetical protein [Actinomycetota bacterium]
MEPFRGVGENVTKGLTGFGEFAGAFPDSDLAVGWGRFDAVHVFSLSRRELLGSFASIFERGGRRLAVVDGDPPVVVAGAWDRYGVAGYGIDGELVWERRDLKKSQQLHPVGKGGVAVGMEYKMMHVVEATTGETVRTVRGADYLCHDGRSSLVMAVRRGSYDLVAYAVPEWRQAWKVQLSGVIDVALSQDAVLTTGTEGHAHLNPSRSLTFDPKGVTCVDMSGAVAWTWTPKTSGHVFRVAWSRALGAWAGLYRAYERLPDSLLVWSTTGELLHSVQLSHRPLAFASEGSLLLTNGGEVLDVPSGRVLWKLTF